MLKEESRKRAVDILNKNKCTTLTKPQIIVNELLNNINVSYENEKGYDYYSVDNYIIHHNLIIEVMGDFWHCNPIKYSEVKQGIQKRRIVKDKAKHNYILNNYNIEILYLWGKDIYENLDLCKYLINYYIESKGKLKNFNSFNYKIDDKILKLKDNIIKNYFEK